MGYIKTGRIAGAGFFFLIGGIFFPIISRVLFQLNNFLVDLSGLILFTLVGFAIGYKVSFLRHIEEIYWAKAEKNREIAAEKNQKRKEKLQRIFPF